MDDNEEYDTNLEDQKKKTERNRNSKSTFGVVKLFGKRIVNFFAEVRDLMKVIYKIKYHKKLDDNDFFRFIRTD